MNIHCYHYIKNLRITTIILVLVIHSTYNARAQTSVPLNTSPSAGQNFILTTIPRVAGYNPALSTNMTSDAMQTIQYFDGLGRPLQTIQVKGSPAFNDVIQADAYDQFGREANKYLPYTVNNSTASGAYQPTALMAQKSFYATPPTGVTIIPSPFSCTGFESSPLNRVLEQGAPGDPWQLTGATITTVGVTPGHTVKIVYSINNAVAFATDSVNGTAVQMYNVTINSNGVPALTSGATYATGGCTYANQSSTCIPITATYPTAYLGEQLTITITKDENWVSGRAGTIEEYKDQEGHVVLKRTYNYKGGQLQQLSTYYLYDDSGNLTFVLPPSSNADNTLPTQSILDNLCYQYQYDSRNRMIQKKLPGKGWEFMVYNALDQVVMTQDANQPQQWTFNNYDTFGRVIMTGLWTYTGSSANTSYLSNVQGLYNAQTILWDGKVTGTAYGYSTNAVPQGTSGMIGQILSVNYYDDYTAPNLPTQYAATAATSVTTPANIKNLPTATLTNILGTTNMLWKLNYYDKLGRITQTYAQHYLGGVSSPSNYDVVTNTYDFTNEVTATNRQHFNTTNTSSPVVTANSTYIYDNEGRKKQTWEQINNGTNVLLVDNEYNEIGQLMTKNLYGIDGGGAGYQANITLSTPITSGQTTILATNSITLAAGFSVIGSATTTFSAQIAGYLQAVNYTYNERGWLLTSSAPLFEEQLQYNTNIIAGINPSLQYNGNIATASWGTASALNTNSYIYGYDPLNRLLSGNATTGNTENNIQYDNIGNLMQLYRYQTTANTPIDRLSYNYLNSSGNYSNQLQSVTDNSGNVTGLVSGTTSYTYDLNGNMETAVNAVNTAQNKVITYNILNLPITNTLPTGTATYTYDADGAKLRKISIIGGNTTTTDYVSGIQYVGSVISFIQTEEGRALNSGGNYHYEYTLTDHLGNSRVNFDTYTGSASVTQSDDYYPFGMEILGSNVVSPKNDYLYNKKELQVEFGQYDYGGRFYDPVIGRWGHIDPKAELYYSITPYAYAANTPINAIDPDGHLVIFVAGQNGGDGATQKYWQGEVKHNVDGGAQDYTSNVDFARAVEDHFHDHNARFYDGASGGWSNTIKPAFNNTNNLFISNRTNAGEKIDVASLIQSLKRTNGVITESIKIIAHSMGAAYAKGLIEAILEYAKTHPKEVQGLSITEYDFAAFQQNKLSAIPGVPLYQYDNHGDMIVGATPGSHHAPETGRQEDGSNDDVNPDGGHSIVDFINAVNTLPIGNYKYIDGKFVKQPD